jgi:hypothetical protein
VLCNRLFHRRHYDRHPCVQFRSAGAVGVGCAPGDRPDSSEAVRARHMVGRTARPATSTRCGVVDRSVSAPGDRPVIASGEGPSRQADGSFDSSISSLSSDSDSSAPVADSNLSNSPGGVSGDSLGNAANRAAAAVGPAGAADGGSSGSSSSSGGGSSSSSSSGSGGGSSSDSSSDSDSDGDGGSGGGNVRRRRRVRHKQWASRGSDLLFPETGRGPTVREYSFYKVEAAIKGHIPRKVVDTLQKVEVRCHGGHGMPHNIPPSLYCMKKVLGIPRAKDFKVEACGRCLHIWDTELPENPGHWNADMAEECPSCLELWESHGAVWQGNRDKRDHVPVRLQWDEVLGRYTKTYHFYYFGLENVITSLDGMPDFRALRLGPKLTDSERYPWWDSAEFKRLDEDGLGGLLQDPRNGVYDLGKDWAPPFPNKNDYTTLFVFLRSFDLPVEDLGTRKYHRTLAVCPGAFKSVNYLK